MQRIKSRIKWVLIVLSVLVTFYLSWQWICKKNSKPDKNLSYYLELIKNDPNNCFYLSQIASSYQSINEFNNAISFYKKEISICPNKISDEFQLGVCFYLIMERELGVKHMDNAIDNAQKSHNQKLQKVLEEEKKSWIDKWNLVKDLDWNKGKK